MSVGLRGDMSMILHGVAFAREIESAASRHGLDARLLAAVAAQETGGPGSNSGSNVIGDGGHGHGLFQIDDRYHPFARSAACMNPAANADYAAGLLASLLHRFGGNVHRALSAYNAGAPDAQGTVTTWADGERLGYADSVMRHYAALGGSFGSLLDEMHCESGADQANVNALSSFASLQLPAPPTFESHPLDRNGRSMQHDDYSIISEDL